MWMTELATNTMMAESRIGSKRAVRGTMRSLLGSKVECRNLRPRLPPKRGCGQELDLRTGGPSPSSGKQGSPLQKSASGRDWLGPAYERTERIRERGAGDAAFGENGGDVARGRDVERRMRGVHVRGDAHAL